MMLISRLHHVAIITSKYSEAKHFYSKVLGLKIISEIYREERDSYKLDLQLPDGTQIELFSFPNPPPRPSQPEACGLRHLAFGVENLDFSINEIIKQGVVVEPVRVDPLTGKRFTFFPDPDGLPIEFYEINH